MSRRTVLALATGSLLLGGFVAPALAAPAVVDENEQICVITRYEPEKGTRDGFCVWFPKVVPDVPYPDVEYPDLPDLP